MFVSIFTRIRAGRSALDYAPEWDMHVVAGRLKLHAHLGADLNLFRLGRIDAAQDGRHAIALVEVDVGGDERGLFGPSAEGAMLDGEGVDAALAAALNPLDLARVAVRADQARIPVHMVAVGATRQHQLAFLGPVPERLRVGAGVGNWLVVGHRAISSDTMQ